MKLFERISNACICLFRNRYVLMEYSPKKQNATNYLCAYSNRMNVSKDEELAIFAGCDGQILDGYKIKVTFEAKD
mgnify:CR=1 FL=1